MLSFSKKIMSCAVACLAFLPVSAFANYGQDYVTGDAGQTLDFRYNPTTQNFTVNHFENAREDDFDAWWLVVTDGPKPETTAIQLIVDQNENIITAYTYDPSVKGVNGAQNFKNGEYLATYSFRDTALDEGFTINVEELNNILKEVDPNGTEIGFSEDTGAGIWMKGGLTTPVYNADGSIKEWATTGNNNIFDKKNLDVDVYSGSLVTYRPIDVKYANVGQSVSEPLAGLALLTAMALFRRRKTAA